MREPNVHKYEAANGQIKYAVCHWVERAAQYQRPLDATEAKLTGCHTEFAKTKTYFGGYTTETSARARARRLYGYSKLEQ